MAVPMMAVIPARTTNQISRSYLDDVGFHGCSIPEEDYAYPCYVPINVQPRGHGRTYVLDILGKSDG